MQFYKRIWLIDFLRYFQQYFSYIMATSFSGGRSRSTRWEPPTMDKQLVNFLTCGCESSASFFWYLQSRARTHIKGSYPQKFPSIWVLNNLVVSEIPLYSTNYVNNRHRLYEYFAKTTFKLDEKVKPLKFWKFALFGDHEK